MKIQIRYPFLFSLFLLFVITPVTLYSEATPKVKNVKKLPVMYEYPVDSTASVSSGITTEKPWIVYSDRNNNVTYTDSKLRTTFKTVNFLESFFVIDETTELIELIKYAPDLLESSNSIKVKSPSKVQYIGWIQKNKLLLSQKSFVESTTKRPLKWVTMLNGKKFIDKIKNYTEADRIRLYDAPDLQTPLPSILYFNELVYVYKSYGDKLLIGKQTHMTPENTKEIILGWVPSSFVQFWGQRLCLEAVKTEKNNAPLVYVNRDASLFQDNAITGYSLDPPSCEKAYNWKKYPVFKIEETNKNKLPYKIFHTGAVTSTFDKSASFIYNVNGAKISYSTLCELSRSNKNINVVIAINAGNDTREYLYALTNVVQELSGYFNSSKNDGQLRFAAVDCSINQTKTEFTNQYATLLPALISIGQKSVEGKSTALNYGIGNGLVNASALFKGHEQETNIIILISSKADTDNRFLKESLYTDMAQKNVRLVFLQPYCGTDEVYAEFVSQAKSVIEATSTRIGSFKRNKVANNLFTPDHARFKQLATGENNIYCLDFPTNASSEGFLVFPTINNKINTKYLSSSLDSLFVQIKTDNELLSTSLQRVFNSSSSFNNSVNKTFQKYYKTQDSLPPDLGIALSNVDYNYFIKGYTAYPENMKPFKLSMLLSTEEYEDLYNMFKALELDKLNDQELKGRTLAYQQFSKLLNNYMTEHYLSIPIYNLTFGDYFYKLFGFYSDHDLLNKYKVYDLNNPNIINKDDLKKMIDFLNKRINSFYALRGDSKNMFVSNGVTYYWISEDYVP